jgi:hypothetical protein
MFNLPYQERLVFWHEFRSKLETQEDPIKSVIDFWNTAPEISIQADPWDQNTWPDPWEMIHDNVYCPFVKILAICYTLQLTDCFSKGEFEINIMQDKKNCETKYLLKFNGLYIGYDYLTPVSACELPETLIVEKSYAMPPLQ